MNWSGYAHEPPRLLCLPSVDAGFAVAVQTVMAANPWVETTADLEGLLREYFPSVRVTERGLHAERPSSWYVYRDGRYPLTVDGYSERAAAS